MKDDERVPRSSRRLSISTPPVAQFPLTRSRSRIDVAADVAEEVLVLTSLTAQLLWAFRVSFKWFFMFLRLMGFVLLLLPGLVKILYYWLFSAHVKKNIAYGLKDRNLLDIYATSSAKKAPVIVFISGGAWIIGYKAWGALMGKVLSELGIIFVTPDYRNFPQGCINEMIEDVNCAMEWVFENIHHFGGDPQNITLVGQSAGAHIAACVLIERALQEATDVNEMNQGWKTSLLQGFIGISGPYNIRESIKAFHERGLDQSILSRIMDHDISENSPTLRIYHPSIFRQENTIAKFPLITLFHGTADQTVAYEASVEFAHALQDAGIPVQTKFYPKKSHTDPIIEDPLYGDDPLLKDIMQVINASMTNEQRRDIKPFHPPEKMLPRTLIQVARYINPF